MADRPSSWSLKGSADDYDAAWARLAAAGANPHGEADCIERLGPSSALDGGCGTGRVAIELARRGIEVVGVDVDATMLAAARAKAPTLTWVLADLAEVELGRSFDVVALPGNVMIFVTRGREGAVVANMARHVAIGGHLVAGFQLRAGGLDVKEYDRLCVDCGLSIVQRWSTWGGEPYDGGDYAVSVHRRDPMSARLSATLPSTHARRRSG